MVSDTRNVKLGVCQIFFGGVDLGYTKGGVEVTVVTETHEVMVDQFGKSAISQSIIGRDIMAKVPLAETTLENMVKIMPGAVLVSTGAVAATGTYTIPTTNPTAAQTSIINGTTITWKAAGTAVAAANEVNLGATLAASLANLVAMINASTDPNLALITASPAAPTTIVTLTADDKGVVGNAYTLAAGTATGATVSGATFTGGIDATKKRVDVSMSIGTDLLLIAKELRLHPTSKVATDKSDDFIPLAATPGALNFAYKLEDERIYNVEFTGYPNPANSHLFSVGDPAATA
jgi:hypothetical protein